MINYLAHASIGQNLDDQRKEVDIKRVADLQTRLNTVSSKLAQDVTANLEKITALNQKMDKIKSVIEEVKLANTKTLLENKLEEFELAENDLENTLLVYEEKFNLVATTTTGITMLIY